jgi:hypothetical protein
VRIIKEIAYNTRAITFRGTVTFAAMGKYVTDFLRQFKGPGWTVTDGEERGDSLSVDVPDANRGALIEVLATMPDEAFGWFVGWASGVMVQYPDGLGGFLPESRASIEALHAAAKAFMEKQP